MEQKKKSSGQQRGEKQKWKSLIGCGRRCHRAAIRDSAGAQRLAFSYRRAEHQRLDTEDRNRLDTEDRNRQTALRFIALCHVWRAIHSNRQPHFLALAKNARSARARASSVGLLRLRSIRSLRAHGPFTKRFRHRLLLLMNRVMKTSECRHGVIESAGSQHSLSTARTVKVVSMIRY